MNDLCNLGIDCLENVKDAEEACNAKLYAKRRLTYLILGRNNTDLRNTNLDEKVLDNFQLPKCQRNLEIHGYMGARSAIWMNNVNHISNLEQIILTSCSKWETLPPFGQLPFLKSLTLWNMPKVKWLQSKYNGNDKYRTFPLLEVLYICELEALEDWFEAGVAAEDGFLFPCLIKLELYYVPMLRELPNLPPSLKRLTILRCHPELFERYRKDGGSDRHNILLTFRVSSFVPMLRELPKLPPSLKRLEIYGKCHPELHERYRKDGGSDRHKIAHIPDIHILP